MQQKNMYSKAINKHMRDRLSLENAKWNWRWLSSNKIITWEIVKDNMDKSWDWIGLSRNENVLLSLDEKMTIVRRHRAASVIQRVWRMVVSNPNYLVCKKRLMYEFTSLENI